MTTTYTAQELIAHAKAYIAADAAVMTNRPAHMPRGAWRSQNPVGLPHSFLVRDTAFKSRPDRYLSFDINGNPYDLWVWRLGARSKVIERIDLKASDAAARLSRYERV